MLKRLALMATLYLSACSQLQNPFTGGSANYQLLQAICSSPVIAANPQFALACAAVGLLTPNPTPTPAPTK